MREREGVMWVVKGARAVGGGAGMGVEMGLWSDNAEGGEFGGTGEGGGWCRGDEGGGGGGSEALAGEEVGRVGRRLVEGDWKWEREEQRGGSGGEGGRGGGDGCDELGVEESTFVGVVRRRRLAGGDEG